MSFSVGSEKEKKTRLEIVESMVKSGTIFGFWEDEEEELRLNLEKEQENKIEKNMEAQFDLEKEEGNWEMKGRQKKKNLKQVPKKGIILANRFCALSTEDEEEEQEDDSSEKKKKKKKKSPLKKDKLKSPQKEGDKKENTGASGWLEGYVRLPQHILDTNWADYMENETELIVKDLQKERDEVVSKMTPEIKEPVAKVAKVDKPVPWRDMPVYGLQRIPGGVENLNEALKISIELANNNQFEYELIPDCPEKRVCNVVTNWLMKDHKVKSANSQDALCSIYSVSDIFPDLKVEHMRTEITKTLREFDCYRNNWFNQDDVGIITHKRSYVIVQIYDEDASFEVEITVNGHQNMMYIPVLYLLGNHWYSTILFKGKEVEMDNYTTMRSLRNRQKVLVLKRSIHSPEKTLKLTLDNLRAAKLSELKSRGICFKDFSKEVLDLLKKFAERDFSSLNQGKKFLKHIFNVQAGLGSVMEENFSSDTEAEETECSPRNEAEEESKEEEESTMNISASSVSDPVTIMEIEEAAPRPSMRSVFEEIEDGHRPVMGKKVNCRAFLEMSAEQYRNLILVCGSTERKNASAYNIAGWLYKIEKPFMLYVLTQNEKPSGSLAIFDVIHYGLPEAAHIFTQTGLRLVECFSKNKGSMIPRNLETQEGQSFLRNRMSSNIEIPLRGKIQFETTPHQLESSNLLKAIRDGNWETLGLASQRKNHSSEGILAEKIMIRRREGAGFEVTFELRGEKFPDHWYFKEGSNKKILTAEEIERLPHEAVSRSLFQLPTDVRMDTLGKLGDDSDRMTPDYIIGISKSRFAVVEVKTVRDDSMTEMKCQEANLIYCSAVRKRTTPEREIKIFGLAVSFNNLVTNMPITEADVVSCIYHYNIAIQIKDEAIRLGFLSEKDDELTARSKAIRLELDRFTLEEENDNKLLITKKMVAAFDNYDGKRAIEVFKAIIEKAKNRICSSELSRKKTEEEINLMYSNSKKEADDGLRRTDLKAPVQLPGLIPKRSGDGIIMPPLIMGDTAVEQLWSEIRLKYFACRDNFIKHETLEHGVPERIRNNKPCNKTMRKKARRITLNLCEETWKKLAESGVRAKRFKKTKELVDKRTRDKLPFDFSCATFDIEEFINNKSWFEEGNFENRYITTASKLVDRAIRITKDEKLHGIHNQIRDILNTKLFLMLSVISEIVSECSYSIAQNCRKKDVILKKLTSCNAWLTIIPTNSKEHIFFSLAISKEDAESVDLPFKNPIESGEYIVFPFLQLDPDRIDQYLYLPLKTIGLLVRQSMIFKGDPENILGSLNDQIRHHFLAETLFLLEDKRQTSTAVQQFRYAYMELICQNDMENPLKIIGKLDTRPKSRLMVWAINNMIRACKIMLERPPIIGKLGSQETDESEDVCQNIISWVDFSEVRNYEAVIELSYYSNLHNKSRKNKSNDNLEILKKIVEEELKYDKTRKEKVGWENCDDPGPHEFDKDFVTFCALVTRERLERNTDRYENMMRTAIFHELSTVTLLQLATTKSSAVNLKFDKMYDPEKMVKELEEEEINEDEPLNKRKTKREKRQDKIRRYMGRQSKKCIIAAYDALEDLKTNYPFTKIFEIYSKVKEQGGVIANLFPKEQIGGAREIFRLEFYSRMVVKFLESVALGIDKKIPAAMLSKGNMKDHRTYEHYSKLGGSLSRTVTSINSMDCKRWAQNFVMPAFACTFNKLLPKELKAPFFSVLNEISKKRLEIPDEVCYLFYMNQGVTSMDPNIQTLKDEFLGLSKPNLLKCKYGKTIKNETNMMQGQCHVVSDVHHASYLYGMQTLLHKLNDVLNCVQTVDASLLITVKCSSDDSSQLISVSAKSHEIDDHGLQVLKMRSKIMAACFFEGYPYNCMLGSKEKSTLACMSLVEEFNSKWLFRNTIIAAPIKHIYTAIDTPCTSSFEMRHYQAQNLLMELFESSGSTILCSFVQILQAYANYDLLGCITNENYDFWVASTLRYEHPMFGFFLLQPSRLSGLFPLEFTKYIACKNNPDTLRAEVFLYMTNGIEYHSEMGRLYEFRISEGQEKKYQEFLEELKVNREEVENQLSQKLWWLHRGPINEEETKMMIRVKAMSPGMADAMVVKKLHKIYNTSAYIYTEPCMTFRKKNGKPEKINFFNACEKVVVEDDLTLNTSLDILFSNQRIYDIFIESAEEDKRLIDCYTMRKRFVNIRIEDPGVDKYLSLKEVLAWKWDEAYSRKRPLGALKEAFDFYRTTFPWLEDSAKDSLKHPACPFDTYMGLRGFINSKEETEIKVRSYCCAYQMSDPIRKVLSVMNNSPWPGKRYCNITDKEETKGLENKLYDRYIQLCLTLKGPFTDDQSKLFADDILSKCSTEDLNNLKNQKMEKLRILACIRNLKVSKTSPAYKRNVNRLLTGSKVCTLGKWEVPSELSKGGDDPYVGRGVWSGMTAGRRVNLITEGSYLQKIILQRPRHNEGGLLGYQIKTLLSNLKQVRIGKECGISPDCSYYNHSQQCITHSRSDFCVPIEESEMQLHDIDFDAFEIEIEPDQRRIVLKSNQLPVLVLKCIGFYSSPSYSPPEFLNHIKKDRQDLIQLWTKWYSCETLTYKELLGKTGFLKTKNDISRWFADHLEEELSYIINPKDTASTISCANLIPEGLSLELMEMMYDMPLLDDACLAELALDVEDMAEIEEDDEIIEQRNEFIENIINEMDTLRSVPSEDNRMGDYNSHCRLFKSLIESIRKDKGEDGMRALTQGWKERDDVELIRISQSLGKEEIKEILEEDEIDPSVMMEGYFSKAFTSEYPDEDLEL